MKSITTRASASAVAVCVLGIPAGAFFGGVRRSRFVPPCRRGGVVGSRSTSTDSMATAAVAGGGTSSLSSHSGGGTSSPSIGSPDLPPDALILTANDAVTWELEKKEYQMLADDPEGDAPTSFAPLLASFEMWGNYYHAFESQGMPLKHANFSGEILARDGGSGPLPFAVSDAVRVALIRDLLEAVGWCHLQGVPHLALDATSVRLHKTAPEPGKRRGFWRLSVVSCRTPRKHRTACQCN